MKRIAVITWNIGGMDPERIIPKQSVTFDRYYVTDQNIPYPFPLLDNRMKAKYGKIQGHRIYDHDILIWIDGNVQITDSKFIEGLCDSLNGFDVAISKHPHRTDIYQEADYMVSEIRSGNSYLRARYNWQEVQNEAEHFRSAGHPAKAGLFWCGLFARVNTPRVNSCFDAWWDDNLKFVNYDQNSFAYEAHRFDLQISIVDWGQFYKNKHYNLNHHLKLQ